MRATDDSPFNAQSRLGEMQQVLHGNEVDEGVSNITAFATNPLAIALTTV